MKSTEEDPYISERLPADLWIPSSCRCQATWLRAAEHFKFQLAFFPSKNANQFMPTYSLWCFGKKKKHTWDTLHVKYPWIYVQSNHIIRKSRKISWLHHKVWMTQICHVFITLLFYFICINLLLQPNTFILFSIHSNFQPLSGVLFMSKNVQKCSR